MTDSRYVGEIYTKAEADAKFLEKNGDASGTTGVVKSGNGIRSRAVVYQTASGSRATPTGGDWYAWNGTFSAAGVLQDFTHSGGVLTYTGSETKVFKVSYSGLHRGTGTGTPAWLINGVSVNDADPAADTHRAVKGSSSATEQGLEAFVTLSQNDNVRMKVQAPAGADGTTNVFWDKICAMTVME